jgi:hypothetical protein
VFRPSALAFRRRQRALRWTTAAALVGVVLSCIGCSEGKHKKKEQQNPVRGTRASTESRKSPQPESRNAVFSTTPFATDTVQVPPGYAGISLEELTLALLDRQAKRYKDEFETTAQYRERLRQLDSSPILGSLMLDSIYAFSFRPSSSEYDADARVLDVRFQSSYCCDIGGDNFGTYQAFGWLEYASEGNSYPAQNAFGAQATVQTKTTSWYGVVIRNLKSLSPKTGGPFSGVVFRISTGAQEARILENRLKILVVCRLQAPFLTSEKSKTEPTIKDPLEETSYFYFVHVRVEQLKAYDPASGRVYGVINAGRAHEN